MAELEVEDGILEEEDKSKDFRRALNAREAPKLKRVTRSYNNEDELDRISIHSIKTTTVEGIPVYRELEEEGTVWIRLFYRLCPQPIRNGLKPPVTKEELKKFLFIHLPIVQWILCYIPKYLLGDIISGLTIGVTHIPQSIGFALLASLPPVFGLYSSFIPVILYAIFGTSRHLSVGTFPVVALMTGNAILSISSDYSFCSLPENSSLNATLMDNITDPCFLNECDTLKVNIAITLSLMVGLIMFLMGILKLGVISIFLSDPLISGYTAAAAFTILATQLASLLGLPSDSAKVPPGYFITPRRLFRYLELLFDGDVTWSAVITSIICFAILITFDVINRTLKKKIRKFPIYIPGQLIVVILATSISYGAKLDERFQLQVINDVGGILPGQCFKPTLAVPDLIVKVLPEAFAIAIIGFVINIAQSKLLAQKNAYSIHPDQELLAYGIMNIGGSFFGSFPTAGALSRTVLQDATGGSTQLVSFISSFIVLLVILALGSLFGPLPNATVGVIVVMALKGLFFQVRDIRRYFYLHWPDMIVWLAVFGSTLIIGLDIGLAVGVFVSMFVVIIRTILPYSPELGETIAWTYPRDSRNKCLDDYNEEDLIVQRIPRIYIFQFNAPLYFANCGVFRSKLFIECGVNPHQFDAITKGCFEQCHDKIKLARDGKLESNSPKLSFTRKRLVEEDEVTTSSEGTTSSSSSGETPLRGISVAEEFTKEDMKKLAQPRATDQYHTIIIDCGPIGFVDSMGMAMLEKVVAEFDAVNIQVLLASPSTPVCDSLNRYGFFKRFSSARLFPTVPSAVYFAKSGDKVPAVEEPECLDKKLATNLERQLAYSQRRHFQELETISKGPTSLYQPKESTV